MRDEAEDLNRRFHVAYDDARGDASADGPVLVLLEDALTLIHGTARTELTVTPPSFHVSKAVAHGPIALFAILHQVPDGPVDRTTRARLEALDRRLISLAEALRSEAAAHGDPPLTDHALQTLRRITHVTTEFVGQLLAAARADGAALGAFAAALGPDLLRCTSDATAVQLGALDRSVRTIVAGLDGADRGALEVVVAGAHQARARSLPMQYFAKMLGEPPGVEERLTYAEGVTAVEEALRLVGIRRLDRAVAGAFFGDPRRLQRDILGDAATAQLAKLPTESPVT